MKSLRKAVSLMPHIGLMVVFAVLSCVNVSAQKSVRIWPHAGGGSVYEMLIPHDYQSFKDNIMSMLAGIPNKESCNYCTTFNWGDDEIMNTQGDFFLTNAIDNGNCKYWYQDRQTFLNGDRSGNLPLRAWYFINLANISLGNLDELTDCTSEQKSEMEGYLYYMRAWWHQELMTYFGAMPYVDYELPFDEITKVQCLSVRECALKCAEDFAKAAELLPLVSTQFQTNSIQNQSEFPNRLAALAYKGKVLLWGASPLNYLGAQTGALANGNTYRYDEALAKDAAEALGAALTLARATDSPFALTKVGGTSFCEVATACDQNFTGLTEHPFRKYGYEQYDADGLVIHNETATDNKNVKCIVGQTTSVVDADKYCILRVTIKGPGAGSLDCSVEPERSGGRYVNCTVPFTDQWETVECMFSSNDISRSSNLRIFFLSGQTVGDIHIKDVKLVVEAKVIEPALEDLFYTMNKQWKHPGAQEAVFANSNQNINESNWNFSKLWGPKLAGLVAHDNIIHMPTANYVNYAYGMANGLPVTDPESGFDPAHPFRNRDPRFYNDIVYDGYKYVERTEYLSDSQKEFAYMHLYTGGNVRDDNRGSRTGYFCKKLVPTGCNEGDNLYDYSYAFQSNLPYMRLADIYLMYAEACAAYGSASTSNNCSLTAEDAINVLRDRAGAGHVAQKLTTDSHKFMDEVRRERACELAFEGHRWSDLSRWLLLTEEPYNKKTSQEFTRKGSFDETRDEASDNEVDGWSESVILTRQLGEADYVFPLDPNNPPEIDIIYSEDLKTLIYYPMLDTRDTFVVPSHVEILGEDCFSGNRNLRNIVLHDGIREIGAGAFANTSIREIEIPELVTSLPDRCFKNTKLESITLHEGITSLGNECFASCNNIAEIHIPASVSYIGEKCFTQGGEWLSFNASTMGALKTITVDAQNSSYTAIDGILYDKAMTHLMQCPNKYEGELTVPEGVRVIDEGSIVACPMLKKLTLPASIDSVKASLNFCMGVTEIICHATVPPVLMFNGNFYSGFTFYVPEQSVADYKNAYRYVSCVMQILPIGSTRQYGPNDLVLMGFESYCDNYTNHNPDIVSHVEEVYVNGNKMDLASVIKTDNYFGYTYLEVPFGQERGEEVVLRMDASFTEMPATDWYYAPKVILPESVKKYNGRDMRFDHNTMSQIILPESLEEMGANSLHGYMGWSVTIPKNVKTIGKGSFVRNAMGEINVDPDNLYYASVDGVLFDKDVKTLIAFPLVKPVADYVVPATVETICAAAMVDPAVYGNISGFSHSTLTLPASLKAVGDSAFYDFHPKKVFCYAKEVPQSGVEVFGYTSTGQYPYTLYVPAESLDAYTADAEWGRFYEILPLDAADAIDMPTADPAPSAAAVRIYGIDGVQSVSLRKGINIVRKGDGTIRTVVVR